MHKAIRVSVDKPTDPSEVEMCTLLIKKLDKLLVDNEISPVTWTADHVDDKVVFTAYIPADCLPELDQAADVIASYYDKFEQNHKDS